MHRFLLLLILLATAGFTGIAQQADLPIMFVHRDVITLKDIRPNSAVPCRFTFSNFGGKPLIIEKVLTSCGCLSAVLSKDTLGPREEGHLDVVYRAESRRIVTSHKITLITNDPMKQEALLTLQVNVEPDLEWEPSVFELDWPPNVSYTGQITLRASQGPVKIKRVSSEKDFLKVEVARQEGSTAVVQFTVPSGKEYVSSNYLFIETDSKDFPVVQVLVYFKKPPEYLFEGERVDFDLFENTPPPVFKVSMSRADGSKVKIDSIWCSQKEFLVKILKNDAKTCEFEITVDKGMRAGPCDGYLNIMTNKGKVHFAVPCNIRKQ